MEHTNAHQSYKTMSNSVNILFIQCAKCCFDAYQMLCANVLG